jgi:branched-subunit amino acid aminotransferase/4-amino-4-deoxychorismate lyase
MPLVAQAVWRGGHGPLKPPLGVSPTRWFAAEPGAVYTATATLDGHRVFGLDAHLDRLLGSLAPALVEAGDLRMALAAALARFGVGEARVLLEAFARSPADHPGIGAVVVLWPARAAEPTLHTEGARAVLAPGAVRRVPGTKHSAWRLDRQRFVRDARAHEHLLLDGHQRILEGFTSNVVGVRRGVLLAPRDGVLPGLARQWLLEAASARGLAVEERPIGVEELPDLDEFGLCSCGRGLVPVVAVDQRPIGSGRPGPVTLALHQDWLIRRARQASPVGG